MFTIAMDTDKIKVFGARVKVDGTGKLAELERAEKVSITSFMSIRWLISRLMLIVNFL